MGVYTRFKKNPDGLRQLIELLETTPAARRKKMIDVGMIEDASYTQKALEYMMTFEDVLKLSDLELTQLITDTPARLIGCAIYTCTDEIKNRFLNRSTPAIANEIKEILETPNISAAQIGSGQLKLTSQLRQLEKRGFTQYKRVPSQ